MLSNAYALVKNELYINLARHWLFFAEAQHGLQDTLQLLQVQESILTSCITAWYGSCTALNRKALQRVVKAAQHITRTELPSMEDLHTQWCRKKVKQDHQGPQPPQLRDSFIPPAIRLLNS